MIEVHLANERDFVEELNARKQSGEQQLRLARRFSKQHGLGGVHFGSGAHIATVFCLSPEGLRRGYEHTRGAE